MLLEGNITAAQFLKHYWQRKPLLLRQALPAFIDPLSPEELAGLACEEEVESRLVFTRGKDWLLKSGPFREQDFTSLPARNWTLLVQSVDTWVPAVKQLLQKLPFLPTWRVDDVMISYATAGGGVGPHFDYYDVFLAQGQGSRRWRIGQRCSAADELRSDSGLKLLRHFDTQAEYTLHPGDVLYVPPGVAHWGISHNDSLSYSIGFRAPSVAELIAGYSEHLMDRLPADQRYTDPPLAAAPLPGEITATAVEQAWRQMQAVLKDKEDFARWFAGSQSEPRHPESIQARNKLTTSLLQASHYGLHPASRIAWRATASGIEVHCDGLTSDWPDSPALRKLLQAIAVPGTCVSAALFSRNAACRQLRDQLLLQGSLEKCKP
jgi:50S ribosomal protein L16 3-hydroxylase